MFDPNKKQLWQQKIESVFHADRFDLMDWQGAGKAIPNLFFDNDAAAAEIGGQPVQDGFLSLYKASPRISENPSPIKSLIEKGMDTPGWQELRENTIGQIAGAGLGAQYFWKEVIKNLPEDIKENAKTQHDAQQQADQAQQQADELQALADLLSQSGKDSAEAQAAAEDAQAAADQMSATAEYAQGQFESGLDQIDAQIKNAVNQAGHKAAEKAKEGNEFVKSFNLAAGGQPDHVDPLTAQQAMQALQQNPNLKALAEFLGWARNMVRGEWRKSVKGSKYMTGYSNHEIQPNRMATTERLAMVSQNPAVKADFYRRVVESSVTHVKFEGGEEKQGRGPLVVLDDQSGSMQGRPHALTTALIWALLEIARRDNREFVNISFSGQGQVKKWEAPKAGQADGAGLLAHLGHFFNGGTEPYQAINMALDLIEAQDLKADVLIITDGVFDAPQTRMVQRCREADANIVTVTIGGWRDAVAGTFSDYHISVDDLVANKGRLKDAISKIV